MSVKPIPDGYHSVTPYLIVSGAAEAIAYYKRAFGATELMQMGRPDGKISHAEIQIGDSRMMLADEVPDMGFFGPKTVGGTPITICLYVADVDATYQAAIQAGGKEMRAVQDQFYGDRSGTLEDPFGHIWNIATHKEDLSQEEIETRMKQMFAG
jgi:PhnB protein